MGSAGDGVDGKEMGWGEVRQGTMKVNGVLI